MGEGKGRKWPAKGARVAEGGRDRDAEKGLLFSDAYKKKKREREMCFRLKRDSIKVPLF